jgi:hypothetical protein
MVSSDKELNLEPRWFTGEEWANGTAERELQREYWKAIDARKRSKTRRQTAAHGKAKGNPEQK